jgi:hypothetical protein
VRPQTATARGDHVRLVDEVGHQPLRLDPAAGEGRPRGQAAGSSARPRPIPPEAPVSRIERSVRSVRFLQVCRALEVSRVS